MADSFSTQEVLPSGRQLIAWVALLFALIALFELPFLMGGVNISDLGKLRPSSVLFSLCVAGFTLVGYAPTLSAFLATRLFQGGRAAHALRAQVKTWRVSAGWYALALFGPLGLLLLDEVVHVLIGGHPPQHWVVLPRTV